MKKMKEMIARVGDVLKQDGIESICLTGEELVRCKYCKLRQNTTATISNGQVGFWCETTKAYRPDDWYCADGERR